MASPTTATTATEIPTLGPVTAGTAWYLGQSVGGDFTLREKLGRGGLATVFLAHQHSLDRLVALKLPHAAATAGTEGLALAGLEHDHIVKVYSEVVDSPSGRRGLCLQYVPGTSLETVIPKLHEGPVPAKGADLLAAIDATAVGVSPFDPAGVTQRQQLDGGDFIQAVCRLGEQVAVALAFTHERGILHCDIKPGNILLTRFGRPMLADFNVAVDLVRMKEDPQGIGGTLRYMSPEQMDVAYGETEPHTVDGRTDIYSLGVVLFELATGKLPTGEHAAKWETLPRELVAVLKRCLEQNPADRYPTAAALAEALAAARRIITARRRMPPAGRFGALVMRHPIAMTFAMSLAPELVGSALNIGYNAIEVKLSDSQKDVFPWVVGIYDALAYAVCLWLAVKVVIGTGRRRREALAGRSAATTDAARRGALTFGRTAIQLGLLGWIPGAIVFPTVIDCCAGPVPWSVYGHFAVSFVLSSLVGIVYSFIAVQFVVLRGMYPFLHHPDTFDRRAVKAEVDRAMWLLDPFLVLATLIPLSGAILIVAFSGDVMTLGFRLLTVGLIGLGMVGLTGLMRAADRLRQLAAVWDEEAGG